MQFTKWFSKLINRISLIGKIRHLYRIKAARRVLNKLKKIKSIGDKKNENNGGQIISYLRKINPYVFEELILTVIEDSNVRIIRNKRYSGDGGIDGIFKLKNNKILIQCKRYKGHINNKDVMDLCNKVNLSKFDSGIFVHTGKTGDKARNTMNINNNIVFISGSVLIDLIIGTITIEEHLHKKNKLK